MKTKRFLRGEFKHRDGVLPRHTRVVVEELIERMPRLERAFTASRRRCDVER